MDPASQALAQRLQDGVRDTLGRRSRAEQAQRQQYLTREEEKALVKFLLLMSSLGQPVRVKYLRSLAFSIARQRSTNESIKRPASTHRSNWTTYPTPGWHYGFSKNGYNDSKISLEWLKCVFDSQTRERAGGRRHVLICDGFGTHETLEILEFCLTDNIILCRLPSHTPHKLQPCDVGPFAPLKTAYREQVERLNRGGVDMFGKEHFTYLYNPARDRALTSKNIRAGWYAAGLFPFNPERVLRDVPNPVAEVGSIEPEAEATSADLLSEVPRTPITPVTTEALTSLHDLIVRDTHALDATNKDRLQKRIQKLASAAKVLFAAQALLKDRNRFLLEINREAKARRSTKSLVLGKAKVMSFEDLEEARAKRAEKGQASVSKPKRGRGGGRGCKRKSDAEGKSMAPPLPEPAHAPVSAWRAPVAKMY
ncbi:DDE-1 domain-containing protein [Pyrenophora tritici-repentis]|uniref:DDE-1 domain containing protein n=2 Tax=Pyrenophora tritici-repentis TaxID=45151 RepID=A0A922N3K4_9PLEO|nr:DDE-1 domain-containing protein [Pyrenophora tritici-repentis]KAI0617936.1 DDE-1 domain-containing protein [Pyrenophora tritici-repentis]KAI1508836.1 DDE-1 domain containing protein [Pyrenophora tritici-repentis]KAI1560874.1 DDE-1 domain containing protein [Pyrenophora tritici-repentis]KAI1685853.1 DDE-1 domain containing protein [Pyrenophora tritici-repentis]